MIPVQSRYFLFLVLRRVCCTSADGGKSSGLCSPLAFTAHGWEESLTEAKTKKANLVVERSKLCCPPLPFSFTCSSFHILHAPLSAKEMIEPEIHD